MLKNPVFFKCSVKIPYQQFLIVNFNRFLQKCPYYLLLRPNKFSSPHISDSSFDE